MPIAVNAHIQLDDRGVAWNKHQSDSLPRGVGGIATTCLGLENTGVALWLMVLSRAFAGLCGGNITVAQAYIADITPPEQRSRRMGLIGMAFGLGFIFGPAIGGLSLKHLGMTGPGWMAA